MQPYLYCLLQSVKSEAVPNSERCFVNGWKPAKRRGCINWRKKLEQNVESWTLPQKKGGGVRLSEHGIQNETNYQFLVEVFMFHLSRSMLLRRIWKRKELHFICLTPCSNHEFDPFWLLHLMSRYTMGTFVIFKLSPLLNDHLLLDNENQSRLKMGGVHLALMKWMFSDGA